MERPIPMIIRAPITAAPTPTTGTACPMRAASTAIAEPSGFYRAHRSLVLARQARVALDHRIGRKREHDHQKLCRERLQRRIQADDVEPGDRFQLREWQYRLLL